MRATNFTIDQVKAAHARVRSGADFPAFIREIKEMGIVSYETYVVDGHTDYMGAENHQASSHTKYDPKVIAMAGNAEKLKSDLKSHQQGHSDYLTFCEQCAQSGVAKWAVSLEAMTCTYYDKKGGVILVENIKV